MHKQYSAVAFLLSFGILLGTLTIVAQTPPDTAGRAAAGRGATKGGGRGRGGGFTLPSVSVRKTEPRSGRMMIATILGWRLAARTDAFGSLTFWEAAAKADASGLAFVEGVSTQKVSADISKNLDYNLAPAEVDKVKARLDELRLRMAGYRLDAAPPDDDSRRKAFLFAKGLGADTIIIPAEAASFPDLDKLANEIDLNVVIVNHDLKQSAAALEGRSKRLGLQADLGAWMEAGVKPLAGLSQLKGRVLALNLRDRSALGSKGRDVSLGAGSGGVGPVLLELARELPPSRPINYPPPPGQDGGATRQVGTPVLLTLDPAGAGDPVAEFIRSAGVFDTAVRPAINYYVDELARLTVISTPERVPADQRQRIDAAIPREAAAKPKKSRKLLVVDLDYNGSFYHGAAPLGNLSLELMAKYTGAFTPVFSNDLDNLKYPKIKQFDAVFLNQIQGDVFADEDAIAGLTRYVREGGGVAGLHAATWASQGVPEFGEMMGATSGAHKYNGEMGALQVDDPNSPLTKQFQGKGFEFLDEFYHYIPNGPYSREKVHVLLSIDPSRKDLPGNQYTNRPDNDYGMVWIRSYGKGRVFNIGLGHRPEFYEAPKMQQMMFAGVQFILGDLDADSTPSAKLVKK